MTSFIPFTHDENTKIKAMWPTHSIQAIGVELSRSWDSIKAQGIKLKLPARKKVRSPEATAKYKATMAMLREISPVAEGWPKQETTMEKALKGRVYGRPRASTSIPVDGRKLARAALHGSTGSAALLCAEAP